jgi:hypothetical protein
VLVELYTESRSCFEFFAHTSFCRPKVFAPFSCPSSPFISVEALACLLKNLFARWNAARGAAGANGKALACVWKDRENLWPKNQKNLLTNRFEI